jgi:hypothetical protein
MIDARHPSRPRGVVYDLDAKAELRDVQAFDLESGEFVQLVRGADGRFLYEAQFEDLKTGRREWVTIGPDPRPDAADRAAPAKGLLRVSRVRAVRVRKRGRITFIAEPRG